MVKVFLVVLCLFLISSSYAQKNQESEDGIALVLNGEVTAVLESEAGTEEVKGRVSAYLRATEASFKEGVATVEDFNIVFFDVPQELLSGRESKLNRGVVGFSSYPNQTIKLDPTTGFTGEINGRFDFAQVLELSNLDINPKLDEVETPTISATIQVEGLFNQAISPSKAEQEAQTEQMSLSLRLGAVKSSLRLLDFKFEIIKKPIIIDIGVLRLLEVARRLCIQPVRIQSATGTLSGDGLNFGTPGNTREWRKADVVFTVRNWMTVNDDTYFSLTTSEESALLAEVDEDDCVEVFFPDSFSPSDNHGGGVTFNGGTASTKVISSDENADFGIDLTHLAHELGHVLTLKHPGSGFPNAAFPHRVDGSSGTLMCPSGFQNDNPAINSVENETNLSNPLLTFAIKFRGAGPDCNNSADCGQC